MLARSPQQDDSTDAPQLTEGICQKLNTGSKDDESLWNSKPTVQLLSLKKVNAGSTGGTANDRYRIILSDGQHFLQAMLATQLNHLVDDDRVGKNTIMIIENMSCQHIQEKRSVCRLLFLFLVSSSQYQTCHHSWHQGLTKRRTKNWQPCPLGCPTSTTKGRRRAHPQRGYAGVYLSHFPTPAAEPTGC
jgi:replication factor A1